jgi:hypothetical protein
VALALAATAPAAAQWQTFVHTASAVNTFLDTTEIDEPAINGDPDAVVVVTQVWNPGGGDAGVFNPHHVGLAYSSTTGRGSIYNEDFAAMPLGASFNVWVGPQVAGGAFRHTTTAANTTAATTRLDHPGLNGCPGAILQATHLRNPGGGSGPRNDHPTSVHYQTSSNRWTLHNQDSVSFPLGATFNVFPETLCATAIEPSGYDFVIHVAEATNTAGSYTLLDHPALNDRPNAIILATTNTSFPAALDPRPIGVGYTGSLGHWGILNEDGGDMPLGATFNLLIPILDLIFVDGFESGDTGAWSGTVP